MVVTIHQPEHLPWLGFFEKAARVDLLVLLDNVQYRHRYFQNRNRIRSHNGECWINVPVLLKAYARPLIQDVRINNEEFRWREKCWRSILLNYRKARFFENHAEFFESVYARSWELLVDLNIELIRYMLRVLRVSPLLVRASELGVTNKGESLILEIAKTVKATKYLSGISGIAGKGEDFEEPFRCQGIEVDYQEFHHPIYRQVYEPFIPCLSSIDLLFNYGSNSLDVIKGMGVESMDRLIQ